MLSKFREIQQQKLDKMLSQQALMKQQAEQEQQRLVQLQQHMNDMETTTQMRCALGLQNLANMKHILNGLSAEQINRVKQLQGDHSRQQHACIKQLSFTKGLEGIISNKARTLLQQQQQAQQKQLDELVSQAYIRQNLK